MSFFISSMCSVARGSTVGSSTPSAAMSSWNCFSVAVVTRRMASFSGRSGKSLPGPRVDLVVHVGDVAHIRDMIRPINLPQQPEQEIEHDHGTCVADVGVVIDRRPAHIHAHVGGIDGLERLLAARERIIKRKRQRSPPRGPELNTEKPVHRLGGTILCLVLRQRSGRAPAVGRLARNDYDNNAATNVDGV